MKQKLLITLGCSLTEGVGCYDLSDLPQNVVIDRNTFPTTHVNEHLKIYEKSLNKFHEFGWPNQLGKKLNYDHVLNLGLGGSSTSGQLKVFLEKYYKEYFENYEVLIVWYLTDPARFSFYNYYRVNNFMAWDDGINNLPTVYFKTLNDITIDPLLEQIFYVRMMGELCENRNWNYLVLHSNHMFQRPIEKHSAANFYLEMDDMNLCEWELNGGYEKNIALLCQHPNEIGYEFMASRIYNQIKKYRPELINNNKVNNFTWEWNGTPLQWFNE